MKFMPVTLVTLVISSGAFSETLCRRSEIDYFSCTTNQQGKIASMCGSIGNDEISDGAWLQFRFGKHQHIELTYPPIKQGSVEKFQGHRMRNYGGADLSFIYGKKFYSFTLYDIYDGAEVEKREIPSGIFYIETKNRKTTAIKCDSVNIEKYFEKYGALANELEAHNNGMNLLRDFYREYQKAPQNDRQQ